jgi:LmbE family N-acetylglucosaminyl deacetylase
MNVLVIAPHPDDESIGCGGSILQHVDRGEAVRVVFLTSGELGLGDTARDQAWEIREREAAVAARVLGVQDVSFLRQPDWYLGDQQQTVAPLVAAVMEAQRPAVVYVPHEHEWHPDHQAAHAIAHNAAGCAGLDLSALLSYEVWTPLSVWDVVEDVSEVFERKLEAIRCYPSQLTGFDYLQSATGLATYRGALAGHCAFAEVFNRSG